MSYNGENVKLVVASVNAEGQSYVESTRELPTETPLIIWDERTQSGVGDLRAMLARLAPETASPEIEPQPGGFMWAHVVREPESQMTEPPRYGMHITRTIDFDFVVSGRQQCLLDEEVVELEAGDCIVLKGANHAWRNVSDEPSAMLYLLHTPTEA